LTLPKGGTKNETNERKKTNRKKDVTAQAQTVLALDLDKITKFIYCLMGSLVKVT
jgi:hypothetical protein